LTHRRRTRQSDCRDAHYQDNLDDVLSRLNFATARAQHIVTHIRLRVMIHRRFWTGLFGMLVLYCNQFCYTELFVVQLYASYTRVCQLTT